KAASAWQAQLDRLVQEGLHALRSGQPLRKFGQATLPGLPGHSGRTPLDEAPTVLHDTMWSLVEDKVMEQNLTATRLGQAVADLVSQSAADLHARLQAVEGVSAEELSGQAGDVAGAPWPCQALVASWLESGLTIAQWAVLQTVLQKEAATWVEGALTHANGVLRDHGVRPEINLRPFIKRTRDPAAGRWAASGEGAEGDSGVLGLPDDSATGQLGTSEAELGRAPGYIGGGAVGPGVSGQPLYATGRGGAGHAGGLTGAFSPTLLGAPGTLGSLHDETRLMTRGYVARGATGADALLRQLNQAVSRQVPFFGQISARTPLGAGSALNEPLGLVGGAAGAPGGGFPGGAMGGPGGQGGQGGSGSFAGPGGAGGSGGSGAMAGHGGHGGGWGPGAAGQGGLAGGPMGASGPGGAGAGAAGAAGGGSQGPASVISPALGLAIQVVTKSVQRHADTIAAQPDASPAGLIQDLNRGKQQLKRVATTPNERATIEIVALLFQAILMEERLPAAIRVWFARLQMPVLRVAVSEPDFFATASHPARVLIDRMGACVMGFVSTSPEQEDALHREIKRVVQVVEAYPDTGRRVFQTVLTEFERFLESYFRDQNQASRKGVSLAQQVEQRETWAIQFTIELRKMLEGVPVHEGVREFLFKVWADVLAHAAVQTSPTSDETKSLKAAATELIWSASAKTTREERAEVLRRLPPLLKTVREGMARAGLPLDKQDQHIQKLNTALAAAFTARSAPLSRAHLKAITDRLNAIDQVLPDFDEGEIDEQTLRDLSGHECDDLEIVADGGATVSEAGLNWARELQVGAWFKLEFRARQEPVQLAWRGLHQRLVLFVTPQGRGVLFQQHRLAAFLQAGLLIPVADESLTTRATREALARLDADPQRLLN
ncbi:MAG: hypothetical protein RI907_3723, partial [Pseudomonadota bacterium]